MAALTWREVSAPNIGSSVNEMRQSNLMVQDGIRNAADSLRGIYDDRKQLNTDAALAQVMGTTDREAIASLVQQATAGGNPINAAAVAAAGNQQFNSLMQREEVGERLLDNAARRTDAQYLPDAVAGIRSTGDWGKVDPRLRNSRVFHELFPMLDSADADGQDNRRDLTKHKDNLGIQQQELALKRQAAAREAATYDRAERDRTRQNLLFDTVRATTQELGKSGVAPGDMPNALSRVLMERGVITNPQDLAVVASMGETMRGVYGTLPQNASLGTATNGLPVSVGSLSNDVANIGSRAGQILERETYKYKDSDNGVQVWEDAKPHKDKSILELSEMVGGPPHVAQRNIESFARQHNLPKHVAAVALMQSQQSVMPLWMQANPAMHMLNRMAGDPVRSNKTVANAIGQDAHNIGTLGGNAYIDAELSRRVNGSTALAQRANDLAELIKSNVAYGNSGANAPLLTELRTIDAELARNLEGKGGERKVFKPSR